MNPAIYNYRGRTELYIRKVKESYDDADIELFNEFINALRLSGIEESRVATYAQFAYLILNIKVQKGMKVVKEWNRKDVDTVASVIINDKGYSYATIATALRTLKKLVHYAKHREVADGKNVKYSAEVSHIKPDKFRRLADRQTRLRPSDLLTHEEFLRLIDAIPRVSRYPRRDKALLYVLYEFAARPSELLNMHIKDVRFYDNYVELSTYGKTGIKTLALVLSYKALLEWLEEHPLRHDPNAYLWYSKNNKDKRISYYRLQMFIKRLAKEAGINKRVWLYLFRHTALTNVEKELGSSITEIYGNWIKGSPIRNRYIHLANSDQKDAILRRYGIIKDSSSLPALKVCYRCSSKNEPDAKVCRQCGLILDARFKEQVYKESKDKSKELEEKINKLEELVDELVSRFIGSSSGISGIDSINNNINGINNINSVTTSSSSNGSIISSSSSSVKGRGSASSSSTSK